MHERHEAVYRAESRAVLATLIRLLGDFDRAEEAVHEAFRAALEKWPQEGMPQNPRAWLISAGRFRSIDQRRRDARFDAWDPLAHDVAAEDGGSPEARVALTLREVCGLTTEQIAHAFPTPAPTLVQRIVRAKAKIRDAGVPYEVPGPAELPEGLDSVLRVVYLVFNEGYPASSGPELMRLDLAAEAIRLGRLLVGILPEAEAMGLLASMLLRDSRRAARSSPAGELILLEEQDRSLWNRSQMTEGAALVERALVGRPADDAFRVVLDDGRTRHERPLAEHRESRAVKDVRCAEAIAEKKRTARKLLDDDRHRLVDRNPAGRAARHIPVHELRQERRLEHAGVVREPGEVRTAIAVSDPRAEIVLRISIRQIQRDGRRLEDDFAVVGDRRHLAERVRVRRVHCAGTVSVAGRDDLDPVGRLELFEQEDEARRARLSGGQNRSWS